MSKTLYLHIGHGKTGTSYLQSVFACSISALRDQGLVYPWDSSCDLAADAKITSGNGMFIERFLRDVPDAPENSLGPLEPDIRGALFSSEWIFTFLIEAVPPAWNGSPWGDYWCSISAEERVERLVKWAHANGFSRIKILLVIRNPISQILSGFQQSIKRAGNSQSIENFTPKFLLAPRVLACLKLFDHWPTIETDVVNYSVVKDQLAAVAASWLEVPAEKLVQPPASIVNRSMTQGELEMQRWLNVILGPSGELISDPLCQELPDVRGEFHAPSRRAQEALWEQVRESVEQVNGRIEPRHHYQFDPLESSPPIEGYTFSRDQIRVIATSLGNEILALREQMSGYSREHYQQLQTQCTALDEHCRRLQEILENLQSRHESLVADRREMKEGYKLLKAEHRTLLKALKSREAELVSLKARPKLFNKVFSTQRWKRRWRRWTKAGVPAPPKVG